LVGIALVVHTESALLALVGLLGLVEQLKRIYNNQFWNILFFND